MSVTPDGKPESPTFGSFEIFGTLKSAIVAILATPGKGLRWTAAPIRRLGLLREDTRLPPFNLDMLTVQSRETMKLGP